MAARQSDRIRQAVSAPYRIENLLSRISDSFVALDRNWVYTFVNEKAAQTFGRTPEQMIGKHIWTEFPEGIGQPFYHAYYRAVETQQPILLEEYYPPYDRWFENRIYPSEDGLAIFFSDITERKKAEGAHQEIEERLSLAVRSANIGLWDWDIRANKVRFSAEWKRQLGYADEEISDDFIEWESRVHPADLDRAKAILAGYLEKPYAHYENAFRMRHKDGTYRWILAQASLFMDEQGKPARMLGSHVDITELRRAEDRFRYQATLLQNISDAIIATDMSFQIRLWNAAAEALYGWTEAEATGRPVTDLLHTQYLHASREATLQAVLETGSWKGEVLQNRRDGTPIPVLSTVSLVRDTQGTALGFIAINRDISDAKRSEERMRQEKQILERIARGDPLPVILDAITRNIEAQAEGLFCTILLLDEDGVRVRHGAAPSMNPLFLQAIDGQPIGPRAGSCGTAAYRREPVYVSDIANDPLWDDYRETALRFGYRACWSTPIQSSTGNILGTFAMYYREPREPGRAERNLIDIATNLAGIAIERKQAEEEIHKLNAELEQRVIERTRELQTANQELEAFSYSVSHDLRAPLRAISGFAAIIARRHRGDLNEEGQHYFDNIVQASERMGQLIDSLLTYSRLGREGVRRVPVSLERLMREIMKNMRGRLEEIQGVVEIAPGLPTVTGDQALLSQVFTNLLENAITYHQPGVPPKVTVDWQEAGAEVIIRVADQGIGIPAEYQEKIFSMFQRLHSEEQYPGTGIGLANVKKSLGLLGGWIELESVVGAGTAFSVHLPKE